MRIRAFHPAYFFLDALKVATAPPKTTTDISQELGW